MSKAQDTRGKSADVVYDTLRDRIIKNQLPGGSHILEETMAADLQVSRTPIREALARLEAEGLVSPVRRHGYLVLPLTAQDIRDIYQVLAPLETVAGELLAAKKPNAVEVKSLQQCVDAMAAALKADDLDAWAEADEDFHTRLVELCGNQRLARMAKQLFAQSHRVRLVTLRLRDKPVNSVKNHGALVDAIRKGRPDLVREVHARQHDNWIDGITGLLSRLNIHQL